VSRRNIQRILANKTFCLKKMAALETDLELFFMGKIQNFSVECCHNEHTLPSPKKMLRFCPPHAQNKKIPAQQNGRTVTRRGTAASRSVSSADDWPTGSRRFRALQSRPFFFFLIFPELGGRTREKKKKIRWVVPPGPVGGGRKMNTKIREKGSFFKK
jgi:hypothetical protein